MTRETMIELLHTSRRIGEVSNYYGGLSVKYEAGKFYWSIENHNGDEWEEIPEYLAAALVRFEAER